MKHYRLIKSLLFSLLFFSATALFAPAPGPPAERGLPGDQPAPVGSGLVVLVALGIAYAAKKTYKYRKHLRRK